ncbi:MAG: hypothetical protein ACK5H1_05795 [Tenacibaculum sp.]
MKAYIVMPFFITLFFISLLQAQQQKVSGKVLDFETSEPLIGAALVIKD